MHLYTLLPVFLLKLSIDGKNDFDTKHKIIKAFVHEDDWWKILAKEQDNGLDIFSRNYIGNKNWLITFQANPSITNLLKNASIKYKILINDMQTVFNESRRNEPNSRMSFKEYSTYEDILDYIHALPSKSNQDRKISLETIGKSIQNRDIKMVKIEHHRKNKIMFFDAGIHAREWLAVMTGLYLIDRLVEAPKSSVISNMNWYIIPSLNPDGYVYSFKPETRLHRKNMNRKICPKCSPCGVDLNRNFGFKFGGQGTSTSPCSEIYRGKNAFSEPESQALRHALLKYLQNIKLYITLHSYGQTFLYPWGYAYKPCADWRQLDTAANFATKAIQNASKRGTYYRVQSSGEGIYAAAGGSDDYAKSIGIKYSYTMEVQEGGNSGFDPPPSSISDYVAENYAGIVAIANYIHKRRFNWRRSKEQKKQNVRKNFEVRIIPHKTHLTLAVSIYFIKLIYI